MKARFEGEDHRFYGLSSIDLRAAGQRSLEWDLDDWKWDGDLFIARQLNPGSTESVGRQFFPLGVGNLGTSSNCSSSYSDELNVEIIEKGKQELEKKRRAAVIEGENLKDDAGNLTLKLGGHGYPVGGVERDGVNWEGSSSKKTKLGGGVLNRAVCQVENCEADLSKVKDYHRRHKVCELHSKASSAVVGGIMQRFCQQCSRFHVLQEFDEGKRSCRRRLAGHNKRRRKTNPDAGANRNPLNDDQTSSYLLISILKILSNMYANRSEQACDQDLLSHLLKSLGSQNGEHGGKSKSVPLPEPQGLLNDGISDLVSKRQAPQEVLNHVPVPPSEMPCQEAYVNGTRCAEMRDSSANQVKMNDFDLNDIYIDSDDGTEDIERSPAPTNPVASSLDYPTWIQQDSHQSSPPQTSRNSDSGSDRSPSSSSGDAQSRTDRIVFKLFGKVPSDFPVVLRTQILDWLSHSPTDMESYIRPGCIILTIYLRQAEAAWDELCSDLSFSLRKLLGLSNETFWSTGWMYARVQNQIAFAYNGQVLGDSSLPLRSNNHSQIFTIKPVAITGTGRAQFTVRGINLHRPGIRLLCAVGGKYLVQEVTNESIDDGDDDEDIKDHDDNVQSVNFSYDIPLSIGRGFVEIEDDGLSSSFFPFIVAEDDVCTEIRMLESRLEFAGAEAAKQAMDFIYEMGWLLHRSQLKSRLGGLNPADPISLRRFKDLIEFSMDQEWCAVMRNLLDIFFDGTVACEEHSSLELASGALFLLHRAVQKNSRPIVELLLRYVPKPKSSSPREFLFRPDMTGPSGLTPLHIAAGKDGSEDVLDALAEDPGMVGMEAWKSCRDTTGFTPEDYARLRGHFSYIHLIQRKINKKPATGDHVVVVDIHPAFSLDSATNNILKQNSEKKSTTFEIGQNGQTSSSLPLQCKLCNHKLAYGYGPTDRSVAYRPVMLSMVAIAAVCVCVALLFKSYPEVLFVFRPFRWELLDYGPS